MITFQGKPALYFASPNTQKTGDTPQSLTRGPSLKRKLSPVEHQNEDGDIASFEPQQLKRRYSQEEREERAQQATEIKTHLSALMKEPHYKVMGYAGLVGCQDELKEKVKQRMKASRGLKDEADLKDLNETTLHTEFLRYIGNRGKKKSF